MNKATQDILEAEIIRLDVLNKQLEEENRELAINLQAALAQLQLLRIDRRYEVSVPAEH